MSSSDRPTPTIPTSHNAAPATSTAIATATVVRDVGSSPGPAAYGVVDELGECGGHGRMIARAARLCSSSAGIPRSVPGLHGLERRPGGLDRWPSSPRAPASRRRAQSASAMPSVDAAAIAERLNLEDTAGPLTAADHRGMARRERTRRTRRRRRPADDAPGLAARGLAFG